ncbi:hypothetical protein WV31_07425 [Magnetospirillum sp. ME-1]|uniref:hypothetical protein n=1 Tax=Magnetospirillum sp. ME-1 TaxID=1639348 RepID=UPI000A17C1FC|nr:hypothetical protein [Magnetospirillum sp. ME-1]ARJ65494.1 hypothetical protein WV31_07425 [Magnetospirillum sp. ME-1]
MGGGGSSSSSTSNATNSTNVDVTSNVQVQNILDTAPLVGPIQNLTDAISGVTTERAKTTQELSATVKEVADKAVAAMDKSSRDSLIIAALALGAAYYGSKH